MFDSRVYIYHEIFHNVHTYIVFKKFGVTFVDTLDYYQNHTITVNTVILVRKIVHSVTFQHTSTHDLIHLIRVSVALYWRFRKFEHPVYIINFVQEPEGWTGGACWGPHPCFHVFRLFLLTLCPIFEQHRTLASATCVYNFHAHL